MNSRYKMNKILKGQNIIFRTVKTLSNLSTLRPYQKECIESTLKYLKDGVTRQAVSLPVGTGKTVIMSHLIPLIPNMGSKGSKVLILAHRQELLFQTYKTLKKYNPKLVIDLERGTYKSDIANSDVILASVQSLGYNNSIRLNRFNKDLFKCIIIDEAHHASASTYIKVLKHFGLYNEVNKNILLWGCSATLRRHDGIALSNIFDFIVYHKDFLTMVQEKWLCDMQVTTIRTKIDLSKVGLVAGDFNQTQLSNTVDTKERNELVVSTFKRLAKNRKSTLVFALNIQHAKNLENTFKQHGFEVKLITSQTPLSLRADYLEEFRQYKTRILINCTILTEGLDIPNVDCILMTRPTRSKPLYQQMLGRGMRPCPSKKNCLILDFVDIHKDMNLCTIPTLLGLNYDSVMDDQSLTKAINNNDSTITTNNRPKLIIPPIIKSVKLINFNEQIIDKKYTKFNTLKFDWVFINKDVYILNLLDGQIRVTKNEEGLYITMFRKKIPNSNYIQYTKLKPLPIITDNLESCLNATETYIRKCHTNSINLVKLQAGWKKQPISDNQLKVLEKILSSKTLNSKYNLNLEDIKLNSLTKGVANNLIIFLKTGGLIQYFKNFKSIWKQNKSYLNNFIKVGPT